MKKAEIGAPVASLLLDILNMLKDNDYKVLRENGFNDLYEDEVLEPCIEGLIEEFCKPLIEYNRDVEIILERGKTMRYEVRYEYMCTDGYFVEDFHLAEDEKELKEYIVQLKNIKDTTIKDIWYREFDGEYNDIWCEAQQ